VAADVTDRIFLYQYGVRGLRGAIVTAGEHGMTYELFARYSARAISPSNFPARAASAT